MSKLKLGLVVLVSSILLVACGGGGGGGGDGGGTNPPPSTTHSVGASFVKGLVSGASCELFQVTSAGVKGASIATGTTSNGAVSFGSNISYQGTALIECSGGTYTDEATGASLTAPMMRAVVTIGGDSSFVVSPLTEIATRLAEFGGNLGAAEISVNAEVAAAFDIDGDITTIMPTDLNSGAAGNNNAGKYGTALAILSQLHANSSGSLSDLFDSLEADLSDGEGLSTETRATIGTAINDLSSSSVAANINNDALAAIADSLGDGAPLIPTNQAPTITLSTTSLSVPFGSSVSASDLNAFVGATVSSAFDSEDGALSVDIAYALGQSVVTDIASIAVRPGTYTATLSITDSGDLSDSETLQLVVESPSIRLVGEAPLSQSPVAAFVDEGAEIFNTENQVIAELSGNVPAALLASTPLSEGAYQVNYSYSYNNADGSGAVVEISRNVTVVNQFPTITLPSDMVTVPFGDSLADYGLNDLAGYATAQDDEDGVLVPSILVEVDSVDVGEVALNSIHPGTYVVTYTATDSNGQMTEEVLTIEVEVPQIALNGLAVVKTKPDVAFVDDGAAVTTLDDAPIETLFATLPDGLDILNYDTGEYELTYTFDFDLADGGSDSLEVTRTVVVTPLLIDFKVLTRVNGVSPETVYFSAQDTRPVTDTECVNFAGDDGSMSEEVLISCSTGQYFGYHFNFGDPNSGNFVFDEMPMGEAAHSKNSQVSAAPRAIHTYVCHDDADADGHADDNPDVWDAETSSCKFEAGVRVQNPGGDFADAYIDIYIQPQDLAYSASNTICVAADNVFADCPAGVPVENQLLDSPAAGEYDGMRVLFKRRTASSDTPVYSPVCVSNDESHVRVDAFGSGAYDPVIEQVQVGVAGSCDDFVPSTAQASGYSDRTFDVDGYLTGGWAFDVSVSNLRLGAIESGMGNTLFTMHNLDLDWRSNNLFPGVGGAVEMVSLGGWCSNTGSLDCSVVPYPYAVFASEVHALGHTTDPLVDPPHINITCLNACGLVNGGIVGSEAKGADEHNARFMGVWGLVVSNSWFRGDHGLGDNTGKAGITLRQMESSTFTSKTVNPEDVSSDGHIRADTLGDTVFSGHYTPSYNFLVDNWFSDETMDADSDTADWQDFQSGYRFSGNFGGKIFSYAGEDLGTNQIVLSGSQVVAVDMDYNNDDVSNAVTCRLTVSTGGGGKDDHQTDTYYYDEAAIFAPESTKGSCPTGSSITYPPAPSAPGT